MAKTKSNIRAICDAGPVIHLDELNCLNLLCDFQEIILSDTVWGEIKHHRPTALKNTDIPFIRSPREYPKDEFLRTMCRIFSLDAGETEALAIIEKDPDSMFLTDDASARLVAEQIGFKVHGTIGIIVRSIRREFMLPSQVLQTLTEISTKSSLHIKHSLLEEIIVKIKKKFQL